MRGVQPDQRSNEDVAAASRPRSVTEHPTAPGASETGSGQQPLPEAIVNGSRPERDPSAPGAVACATRVGASASRLGRGPRSRATVLVVVCAVSSLGARRAISRGEEQRSGSGRRWQPTEETGASRGDVVLAVVVPHDEDVPTTLSYIRRRFSSVGWRHDLALLPPARMMYEHHRASDGFAPRVRIVMRAPGTRLIAGLPGVASCPRRGRSCP